MDKEKAGLWEYLDWSSACLFGGVIGLAIGFIIAALIDDAIYKPKDEYKPSTEVKEVIVIPAPGGYTEDFYEQNWTYLATFAILRDQAKRDPEYAAKWHPYSAELKFVGRWDNGNKIDLDMLSLKYPLAGSR